MNFADRRFARATGVVTTLILACAAAVSADNPYLQRALNEKFGRSENSIVMVDVQSGALLAAVHAGAVYQEKHPPGSLIKLFTTVAYAAEHEGEFPNYKCPRSTSRDPDGCWDRNGHGEVGLEKAIAFSCNVYFRRLAEQVSPEVFAGILLRFGVINDRQEILSLPLTAQRKLMVGNTLEWSGSPLLLLRSYCALYNGGKLWAAFSDSARNVQLPATPLLEHIRAGMRWGGESGTSALASRECGTPLLGKTGTSLLLKNGVPDWSRTQGWWIGLYPVEHPIIAVMTFVRKGRGAADAAPLGGRALAEYLRLGHGAGATQAGK